LTALGPRVWSYGERGWRRLRASAGATPFYRLLAANMANNAASFALTVAAARILGPDDFASFALAVTLTSMLAMVLAMGQNLALVRLHAVETPAERPTIVRAVLGWQLLLLALLTLLLPLLTPATVRLLPVLAGSGMLTAAGLWAAGLLSVWTMFRALDQARGDFDVFARHTLAYAGLRIAAPALVLPLAGVTSLGFFLSLYPVPLALLLGLGWFTRYRAQWAEAAGTGWAAWRGALRRSLGYGRWVALSALLYGLLFRLPQIFLSREATAAETGLYSAALTFLAVFSLLNDTLRTLLLPRVAGLASAGEREGYRRALRRRVVLLLGGLLGVLAAVASAQWLLLGPEYRASVPLLLILGSVVAATLYLGLLNMIVHAYGIPSLDAGVNLARVALLGIAFAVIQPTALATTVALAAVLLAGELALYGALKLVGTAGADSGESG
jgi:O-antigen/teichoic acid export membrane protein